MIVPISMTGFLLNLFAKYTPINENITLRIDITNLKFIRLLLGIT